MTEVIYCVIKDIDIGEYEQAWAKELQGVFGSRESAQKYIDSLDKNQSPNNSAYFGIEEWEVRNE